MLTSPAAGPLELYDFEVVTLVLSAKNWRTFSGPMMLCVDSKAFEFLRKLGVLPLYDRILLFDNDDFTGINRSYFWAAGKVVAATKLPPPFVILDLDCAIHALPPFDLTAAVQPLNLERDYPCYHHCEAKYGHILTSFTPGDWGATPVNVGMLGYYDTRLKDEYLSLAIRTMREITSHAPPFPWINPYRDHIIFVEQKLLPIVAQRMSLTLAVFEEGYYDGYLSTARVTHLWGMKGEFLRHPDWKLDYCAEMLSRYPHIAKRIANPETSMILRHPTSATRVFIEPGYWGSRGSKRWEVLISEHRAPNFPRMHCYPMPCGVIESKARINFETKERADAYIEYGPAPSSIGMYRTRRKYHQTLFNFDIPQGEAQFAPGSLVHYRVRARSAGSRRYAEGISHAFRLARSISDTAAWSCSIGSDCSGERHDEQSAAFKSYHWPAAGRAGEDFHIAAGDLIHARPVPSTALRSWRSIRSDSEGLGREGEKCGELPVFFCLGDDEEDGISGNPSHQVVRKARFSLGPFLELAGQQTPAGDPKWRERYYYFTWGKALFVGLDCETNYCPGNIGRTQRVWVEKTLSAFRRYKWKVLFAHRSVDEPSPGSSGTIADSPGDRRWLLDVIEKHNVQLFLHGHYHGWRFQKRNGGKDYHLCAAWGSDLDPTRGSWHGQSYYSRLRFGLRWTGRSYRPDDDCLTVEIVNPFRRTAAGGRVERYFSIEAGPELSIGSLLESRPR